MKKGLISVFFALVFMTSVVKAEGDSPASQAPVNFETTFNLGVQLFDKKDYEKARDAFAKAVELDPYNSSALTNLALVQFKLNQKGPSIANFRKVLERDPENPTAVAGLKFALSQLEIKEIPHQIENYETIRAQLLQPVSLNIYLSLAALCLFAGGWALLSFIGSRKRKLAAEEIPPGFPVIATLLCVAFLTFATLAALKFYDQRQIRGTIADEKVSVQAAPGDNQVVLFELYAGFEVIVQKEEADWIQVTYPGASTGWIKKSSLILTNNL